jgi:hypothetical protein
MTNNHAHPSDEMETFGQGHLKDERWLYPPSSQVNAYTRAKGKGFTDLNQYAYATDRESAPIANGERVTQPLNNQIYKTKT